MILLSIDEMLTVQLRYKMLLWDICQYYFMSENLNGITVIQIVL